MEQQLFAELLEGNSFPQDFLVVTAAGWFD